MEHVVNHGLTMTEAGRRVQPMLGDRPYFVERTGMSTNVLLYCNDS